MALPASTVLPSTRTFQIKLCQSSRLHGFSRLNCHHQISPTFSMRKKMAQFAEPNRIRGQLSVAKERLREAVPRPVKDVPWKKAKDILFQQLTLLGEKVLKWSLVTWFILSSISDVIFSISANQELIIPLGLLIGCLVADFLKETSQEMLHNRKGSGLKRQLLGICSFFVFVKFISGYFGLQTRLFLLHVGNGGLMQVLWLWRSLLKEEDAPLAEDAQD